MDCRGLELVRVGAFRHAARASDLDSHMDGGAILKHRQTEEKLLF